MPLYVVATPIGNLEDVSARALRILREADVIAAEDTRVTRKLLSHFDIHTPLVPYHGHSGPARLEGLLARLAAGENVALVSDAGTPGISDPGARLIQAALAAGAVVRPIPGPSAVIAALCSAGLEPARFVFEGFLPRQASERRRALDVLRVLPHTLVFYEAPGRVADTLHDLREALGDRRAVVARELTKRFEELRRGVLSELEARFTAEPPRGECVLLVAGAGPEERERDAPEPESVEHRLRTLLQSGVSARDAARQLAVERNLPRRELYGRAVQISSEGIGPGGSPCGPTISDSRK